MAHSHSNSERLSDIGPQPLVNPDELRRHQRALRILIVALIPLAIWTVVGLIAFWPGDISRHVNAEVAGHSVPGVTYPTARITSIKEISCEGLAGSTGVTDARCADVTSQLLEGDDKGTAVTVPITAAIYSSGAEVGQVIKLVRVPPTGDEPAQYQFADFERGTPLLVMALIFAVVVIVVARWRGFAALLGLGFAGFILVTFMFPALIAGSNPIMIGLIGSAAIMFVALYAAHGFSARTTTALVGTLFGLILIAVLGYAATKWSHLTGVAAEDDYLLAAAAPDLKLTSVVICGIIVAGLGILNDVTITQASAVWELADQGATQKHLFSRAMRIGRDHIASTVYTIAFARRVPADQDQRSAAAGCIADRAVRGRGAEHSGGLDRARPGSAADHCCRGGCGACQRERSPDDAADRDGTDWWFGPQATARPRQGTGASEAAGRPPIHGAGAAGGSDDQVAPHQPLAAARRSEWG